MGPLNYVKRVMGGEDASNKEYDYIVVGGGTAGCVLANRLTREENKRVLVVEAGSADYKDSRVRVPAGVLKLFKNKHFDWDYTGQKEQALKDREIYLCRGKVLGGSSCANVLLYHRGDEEDYKQWSDLTQSDEWSPNSVLPYFKKSEHDYRGPSKYHGIGGEYAVSEVRYQNPLSKTFLLGCKDLGFPSNDDFNNWSRDQAGYGRYQVNELNGERSSAASGFLDPILNRKNLDVIHSTRVNKITFDGEAATGIELEGGKQVSLKSDGEVLLTGGAINSPQILMLSGIGPKKHLEEHGIKVVKDLPGVGQNLQDHPAAIISYKCKEGNEGVSVTSKIRIKGTTMTNPKVILQWLLRKSGPLTSTGCDHGGFFRTSPEKSSPDLQMRFISAQSLTADGMGTYTKFRESAKLSDGFSVQSIAARARSTGSIELKSSDPTEKPLIRTGYLTDENKQDIKTLREGIKMARKIVGTQPFDQYRGEEVFPGPAVQSDTDIDEYIRESVHTSNAVVGTCKMSHDADEMGVVTPELKVRGVKNLRVIDASVMPQIPGGQTGAPTVMIAEKAADFMLSGR